MQFFSVIISAVALGASQTYALDCNAGFYVNNGSCAECTEKNAACPGTGGTKTICNTGAKIGTTVVNEICTPCVPGSVIFVKDATTDDECVPCSNLGTIAETANYPFSAANPYTKEKNRPGFSQCNGCEAYTYLDPALEPFGAKDWVNELTYECKGGTEKAKVCPPNQYVLDNKCTACNGAVLCRLGKEWGEDDLSKPKLANNYQPLKAYPGYRAVDLHTAIDSAHKDILNQVTNPANQKIYGNCQFGNGFAAQPEGTDEKTGKVCNNGVQADCKEGNYAQYSITNGVIDPNSASTCKLCDDGFICKGGIKLSRVQTDENGIPSDPPIEISTCKPGEKANDNHTACEPCAANVYCRNGVEVDTCQQGYHITSGGCQSCKNFGGLVECNGTHINACPNGHMCSEGMDNGPCPDGTMAMTLDVFDDAQGGNAGQNTYQSMEKDQHLYPKSYQYKRVCVPCPGEGASCTQGIYNNGNSLMAGFFTITVGLVASHLL